MFCDILTTVAGRPPPGAETKPAQSRRPGLRFLRFVPEIEYFYSRTLANGTQGSDGGYFDLTPLVIYKYRRTTINALEQLGDPG